MAYQYKGLGKEGVRRERYTYYWRAIGHDYDVSGTDGNTTAIGTLISLHSPLP